MIAFQSTPWSRLVRTGLALLAVILLPQSLSAQIRQRSGTVEVSIAEDFARPAQLVYTLREASGRRHPLRLSQAQVNSAGGAAGIAGRSVSVAGSVLRSWTDSSLAGSPVVSEEISVGQLTPLGGPSFSPPSAAPMTGSLRYVVVGCKFLGMPGEPTTPAFWSSMMGGSSPGLGHYFQEVSGGALTITGSQAPAWVTLPQPRSFYGNGSGGINQALLVQDCLTAADPLVTFPGFDGIILQFNEDLGGFSWAWITPMSWFVDGQMRTFRTVVLANWAATHPNTWAHELLHTFGLWHSSGSSTYAYTSWWDVLSHGQYSTSVFGHAGNVGVHTIAGYKALLGWLPPARIYDAPPGLNQIALERSALPVSGSNFRLARIPIAGTNQMYTVEVRRFAGYDQPGSPKGMAGEGVIIHRMTVDGSILPGVSTDVAALVMDGDGNGNVNDAGAIWLPGETFTGSGNVSIRVDQALGSSAYLVTLGTSTTFRLQVAATGAGRGRVTSNPSGINCYYPGNGAPPQGACQFDYNPNTLVTLTQVADPGSSFVRWLDDCANLSCAVDMTQNRAVTAEFAALCTVTVGAGAGGTAALTSGTATGACGRNVTITATPNAGFLFKQWSNGSTANPITLTVNSSQTLTASFTAQCTLTLTAGVGGTVAQTAGSATGNCGRSVTVTATPSTGFSFGGWSDGQTANPYTITLNTSLSLAANFGAQCTLTLGAGAGGTATLSSGTATGECGRSVTVTATPSTGYTFRQWSNGSTANPTTLTLSSSQTLTASFTAPCILTLLGGAGGTTAVTGGTTSGACGRSVTVTAMPSVGFSFGGWSDGATTNPYTITLDASQSLAANFGAVCAITLVASPANGGSVTVMQGGAAGGCGRQVTVMATAAPDWTFLGWTLNGVVESVSPSHTFVANTSRTMVASFTAQCTLTLNAGAGGTVTLSGSTATGNCGRSVTVTATPHAGFRFEAWSDGVTVNPRTLVLDSSRNLAASFLSQCTMTVTGGLGGQVALSSGTATGDCGRTVVVTATPAAGWSFTGWYEGAVLVSTANPLAQPIAVNRTLSARFLPANLGALALRTTEELMGARTLTISEQEWLDAQGNRNGRVDLGDLLALLDQHPGLVLAPAEPDQAARTPSSTPDTGSTKVTP